MIGTIIDLGIKAYEKRDAITSLFSSKYLNYDVDKILSDYSLEEFIGSKIPYVMVHSFIDAPTKTIEFKQSNGIFSLKNDDDNEIKSLQVEALKEFRSNGKLIIDDHTVSLRKIEDKEDVLTLCIQQSKYSDQVQSHLVLDWKEKNIVERGTLRGIIKTKYKSKKLPPLNCSLLSNSFGISVIIYYKNSNNEYSPYLPFRNKSVLNKKQNSQALYEGVYHCSASGSLKWKEGIRSIDWFKEEMYREIEEEIGIRKDNIIELKPLAIVRELLRAGKPQVFFVGYTDLNEKDLEISRKTAIRIAKSSNEKIEIKNKILTRDFNDVKNRFLSLEAIGNLFLAEEYNKNRNEQDEKE